MPNTQNRIKIAKSFDSATQSYDISARLQRFSGKHLLPYLPEDNGLVVIDLGCGTGFFTELLVSNYQRVIGVDISANMLSYTQRHRDNTIRLVAGDALKLPFQDNSIDCIYSNLVIQWCKPISALVSEIHRVLKPGGSMVFTTLVDGTLHELRSSWKQVDDDKHVIDFYTPEQITLAFNQGSLDVVEHELRDVVLEYENVFHLAKELKGLGANHVPDKKNKGLAGKEKWMLMMKSYDDFVEPSGIYPATYKVYFAKATKRI